MSFKNPFDQPDFAPLASLPPAWQALLRVVTETAEALAMPTYIVGGFVRDLILGQPHTDVDVVVEGDATALGEALKAQFAGDFVMHARFGTVKWVLGDAREAVAAQLARAGDAVAADDLPDALDLISARHERYAEPAALPTVTFDDIQADLARRDFPINTLALRLDGAYAGELLDPLGGVDDLQAGRIRVLHEHSFIDDPTRMLRALRYAGRYGFEIDASTLALLKDAVPLLSQLSGDRIRHELDHIFEEQAPAVMLEQAETLGVLGAIHEGLRWDAATEQRLQAAWDDAGAANWALDESFDGVPRRAALSYLVWLLALPSVSAASIAGRLRLPGWLTKAVLAAARTWPALSALAAMKPSEVTAALDPLPLLAVYGLWLASMDAAARDQLAQYARTWRSVQPRTDGHALGALGLPPGPRYGEILDSLRAAWLDGDVHDAAGEQRLLEDLLAAAHE